LEDIKILLTWVKCKILIQCLHSKKMSLSIQKKLFREGYKKPSLQTHKNTKEVIMAAQAAPLELNHYRLAPWQSNVFKGALYTAITALVVAIIGVGVYTGVLQLGLSKWGLMSPNAAYYTLIAGSATFAGVMIARVATRAGISIYKGSTVPRAIYFGFRGNAPTS
jgi:hypothetical protein